MFSGAGTTALVSLKQNKRFIGFEINQQYIDISNKRLKPYLEQTKLTEMII
jgi:site-specific DNA-methyltransferase (adenine-specific)